MALDVHVDEPMAAVAGQVAEAFNATQPPTTNAQKHNTGLSQSGAFKRVSSRRPYLLSLTGVSLPPLLLTPLPPTCAQAVDFVDFRGLLCAHRPARAE